jgi:hypothetical protein
MRKTSLEAYATIRDNGLLSKRRFEVYEYLYQYGPLTIADLCARFQKHHYNGSFAGRISELAEMGVIEAVGEKVNDYSGMKAILWDVTDALPRKLDHKQKRKTFWGLFHTGTDERPKLFRTRDRATAYKQKNGIHSVLHEFELIA